jgi:hypothetical protein
MNSPPVAAARHHSDLAGHNMILTMGGLKERAFLNSESA